MKDNKHPHHDLIVEWAEDTNKVVQFYSELQDKWMGFVGNNPDWGIDAEFRFKPREFTKGHWYPCLLDGREFVCKYDGEHLQEPINTSNLADSVCWTTTLGGLVIGDSLGEINFGE